MNAGDKNSLIVISGPTGSGKSALALELARRFNGEIISADSVQVYRGFNIGSAKPSKKEQAAVPHHLISILDPEEPFDAARFVERADQAISAIYARGRIPFVVGGTGLYIRALLCGLVRIGDRGTDGGIEEGGEEPIAAARKQIEAWTAAEAVRISQAGPELTAAAIEQRIRSAMHGWLEAVDPAAAAKIRPADAVRVRRALSVKLATGESLYRLQQIHSNSDLRYRTLILALLPERQGLYQAINGRVDEMIDNGLVTEVEGLLRRYPRSCRAFGSIGYKQIVELLYSQGSEGDFLRAIDAIKRDSRRFAKRQLTWWRNQPQLLGWHNDGNDAMGEGVSSSFAELLDHLPGKIADFISRNGSFQDCPVSAPRGFGSSQGADSPPRGSGDGNSVTNGAMIHLLRLEGVSI